MKEEELIEVLNSLDDDLIEKEIDKLLEGVDIDMNSIKEKAHRKLNNNKTKSKKRKKAPYIAAACICALSISTVYAGEISEVLKSFLNKTPIYSTIVDGDAYYLKESYKLNDDITIESLMASDGNMEMEITTSLSEEELGSIEDISIIFSNDPNTVYSPGGYSENKGKYFYHFMNKTLKNYDIKPSKDFKITIDGSSYDISLEKAKGINLDSKIYTANIEKNNVSGVNMGAKISDEDKKTNIQIITSFKDKDLELDSFGKLSEEKRVSTTKNLGKDGIITSSTGTKTDEIYVHDKDNNKYELKVPKDSKGRPVTIFETDASKGKSLTLKIPSIITSYKKDIESFSLNIPKEGEVSLNKEIDFNIQKAIAKNIKRTSPTTCEIEFELNSGKNKNVNIRSFNFTSNDVKKIDSEFEGNKAVIKLEFDNNIDETNIVVGWPQFEMNGNWEIDMK